MSFFFDKSKIRSCHLCYCIEILKKQICYISKSEETIIIILLFLGKITPLMAYVWEKNNATVPLFVYNMIWISPFTVESINIDKIEHIETWMKIPTISIRTTISSESQSTNRWVWGWLTFPLRANGVSGAMDCPSVQTQPPI